MKEWGYKDPLLRRDYEFGQGNARRTVAYAAFAHPPLDARTACIAIIEATGQEESDVAACRDLGAPVVFACHEGGVGWWRQGSISAERLEEIPAGELDAFLREQTRTRRFAPLDIYRAKTRSRLEPQLKLRFVDEMLMPIVERAMGQQLSDFVVETFTGLAQELGAARLTKEMSHQLLRDTFWLLAAKILHDKKLDVFAELDPGDVDQIFRRVRRHYGETAQILHRHPAVRAAGARAAQRAFGLGYLGQVTTEALAHVYETTLVTPELRKAFGVHGTPPYLVDYILGRLDPWIEQMDWRSRRVFEPACGHGAFLVAAMRRLRELLPEGGDAHGYLQQHLHGLEIDDVAREIARLSLTLADIPHPDGWRLDHGDMFDGDVLARSARQATILLANPPFEEFTPAEQGLHASRSSALTCLNKTAEMLWRTLPSLPPQAIFGVIVPRGMLHRSDAGPLRQLMLGDFELNEVLVLPDKVFAFADVEAAVLVGRKLPPSKSAVVHYRHVREADIDAFRDAYIVHSHRTFPQEEFAARPDFDLRMPDLEEVWKRAPESTLHDVADVGQGLTYHGKSLPGGAETWSPDPFDGAVRGYVNVGKDLQLHDRPPEVWMSLGKKVVRRALRGATVSEPQVLINYHPVSRGPWRLKAIMDREGHAVSASFLVVRPRSPEVPLEFLWALCNSPYANVYAYTHATKRDITAGIMRKMPAPRCGKVEIEQIARAAREYIDAVTAYERAALRLPREQERCRRLLLAVDASVLRSYNLPARLERSLLDVFRDADSQRAGVPGTWPPYFPDNFAPRIPLYVYRAGVEARDPALPRRAHKKGLRAVTKAPTFGPGEPEPAFQEEVASEPLPGLLTIEEEIDLLHEELAGLDAFRAEYGSTPALEARAAGRGRRLVELQEAEEQWISAAFRRRSMRPAQETVELFGGVASLLEKYGDTPRPDPAAQAADREKA